jgi:anti-sigma B factor antagonist
VKIEVRKDAGGVALIYVEGEVDMHTSPNVRDTLLPYFKRDMKGIIIDLSGVTYMDSSGIATMIEGLQWSNREGGRFVLAGLSPTVMDVFVLTNLKDVFEFSADSQSVFNDLSGA